MSKKTYKEKVRDQFEIIINKYTKSGNHGDGHTGILTKYTKELTEKYFDQAFEDGKLPQDLINEFSTDKFNHHVQRDGTKNTEILSKWLTKFLTGLIQNTAKEIKENIQNLTDDQIQAHKEDIASFAELETMCSTDCDCEESCAADIHYIVNIESDGRMKAYLETNKNEISKLIKHCNEYKIDTDTALNFIQMLSFNPDAKVCLDKICKFEYKYETTKEFLISVSKQEHTEEILNDLTDAFKSSKDAKEIVENLNAIKDKHIK